MLELENAVVYHGSNLDVLPTLPDNSVDSIVTDPPYELGFMGKSWDSSGIAYSIELWAECMRVLKPGGHLLAFSGSRTYHRMVVAIEDAGFEIRDMISWISNKTFPKSHNIGKATGKDEWEGWGTALKPTVEPIVMARKPFPGTVAANVLAYGTGGLNIDASRIGAETVTINTFDNGAKPFGNASGEPYTSKQVSGRWPANVILDANAAELLDEQSGISKPSIAKTGKVGGQQGLYESGHSPNYVGNWPSDKGGGASRFFYVARATKSDRNEGLDKLPNQISQHDSGGLGRETSVNKRINEQYVNAPTTKNFHPTVKPTLLMEYLIKLVTPIGGVILDPFTGSGSTGKAALLNGYKFIGIELTEEYLPIIEGRLKWAIKQVKTETLF
jgi:site-specific DNA-methyltransferase (adenine-specific)